jgi:hypothetical protein
MEKQKTQSSQQDFEKKNKVGELAHPDNNTHYKAAVIRTLWYWRKTV